MTSQGRFLLRLPKEWNGKLVVAGAAGTRSEFNGDLVISDYVLQKGYAYASQNKGTMNYKPADNSNLSVSCPLHPVADAVAGSEANPLLYFALLDDENSLIGVGRADQSGCSDRQGTYRSALRTQTVSYLCHGGIERWLPSAQSHRRSPRDLRRRRRVGSGFVATKRSELHWRVTGWPEKFLWYRAKGLDPNSDEAKAIQAAHFPPDLVENGTSLWTLNCSQLWELTECLYVRKLDPDYNKRFPGLAAFADYNYVTRPESVRENIEKFANNGVVRKPLISVHGTLDALIPLKGHARRYKAMVEAKGYGQNYRLYEIQNGNHIDRLKGDKDKQQLPNLELIQPHAQKAFDLLEDLGRARHRAAAESVCPTGRVDRRQTSSDRM